MPRTLLLVAAFLFVAMPAAAHAAHTATVTMNSTGFFPSTVTVDRGGVVIFNNTGNVTRWPASNIHPTHTAYPGTHNTHCTTNESQSMFDPCRGIAPGETWQFTFHHAGTWRYHDHLTPEKGGVIRVNGTRTSSTLTTAFTTVVETVRQWWNRVRIRVATVFTPDSVEQEWRHATFLNNRDVDTVQYWMIAKTPEAVLHRLVNETGGGRATSCHQAAHDVGHAAYDLYGADVFQKGDSSCHSGFYHGAMEKLIVDTGVDDFAPRMHEICNQYRSRFKRFECLHGIGHGVMAYTGYDLPAALEMCRGLQTWFAKKSCYGGVFMENVIAAMGEGAIPGHDTPWISADPHYPCNALPNQTDVQESCYLMQTSRMHQIFGGDHFQVAAACRNATPVARDECFQSFGRDAGGRTFRDPVQIRNLCHLTPDTYFDECIEGGVNVIIDFWGGNLQGQPHAVCKEITAKRYKAHCYTVIGSRLPSLYPGNESRRQQICGYSEDRYESVCRAAAQLPAS